MPKEELKKILKALKKETFVVGDGYIDKHQIEERWMDEWTDRQND